MGLEDIQKKIIADAETKKKELIAVAKQNSEKIIADGKKDAQEYQNEHEKSALNAAENIERGLIIDARRKLANEILAKKREKIEGMFINAKADFIASSYYPVIMKTLVLKSIQSKKEMIILGQDEKTLDLKWLDDINKTCSGNLTIAQEKGEFIGGLLLKEEDSFVNITVDILYTLLRQDVEKPIADILFKG